MAAKIRKQPSHYPFLPFHTIRSAQFLSSFIVSAFMSFFCWHLRHDHYKIPWTFLVLFAVSLLTLITLFLTIILYCCRSLNPRFNFILNIGLAFLWSLGFALLAWNMSGTLRHKCHVSNWGDESGVMVCRIYKALFTFALVGLLSTYSALSLDLLVRRRQAARGKYGVMQDLKMHEQDIAEPRASGGPLPTGPSYPYSTRKNLSKQPAGYAVPEEQVSYGNEYHSGYHQDGGRF